MAVSRRSLLQSAAAAATAGCLDADTMQQVHHHAAEVKQQSGAYQPACLTAHEFQTVQLLAALIIPPEGADPGGAGAGAPEYIDLLCSGSDRMARIWQGGLAWLDAASRRRVQKAFLDAAPADRTALLDQIAFRRNASPELNPGIDFFEWARRMVVDAWATSPTGFKALGFQGNTGMETFQVPTEALTYALKRSPFGA
ncbi:MAG: gluconate 2-dehydrogenase subunit 3 family protein [Acidobacteria bacterium]|nr:gluconate 2-dehydrogenase subunit 3 family protein [Acidobacteriota bacterium]